MKSIIRGIRLEEKTGEERRRNERRRLGKSEEETRREEETGGREGIKIWKREGNVE